MKLIALAIVVAAVLVSVTIYWTSRDTIATGNCIGIGPSPVTIYPDITAEACVTAGGIWTPVP